MSSKANTSERHTWQAMKYRCLKPTDPSFKNYGGRGIRVCERWLTYAHFLADMGHRPSPGHSVDRINNDGHYEPGNCRWATNEQQSVNRRNNRLLTINGETKTVTEWARSIGVRTTTIFRRLDRGWSPERAIDPRLVEPREGLRRGSAARWAKHKAERPRRAA